MTVQHSGIAWLCVRCSLTISVGIEIHPALATALAGLQLDGAGQAAVGHALLEPLEQLDFALQLGTWH